MLLVPQGSGAHTYFGLVSPSFIQALGPTEKLLKLDWALCFTVDLIRIRSLLATLPARQSKYGTDWHELVPYPNSWDPWLPSLELRPFHQPYVGRGSDLGVQMTTGDLPKSFMQTRPYWQYPLITQLIAFRDKSYHIFVIPFFVRYFIWTIRILRHAPAGQSRNTCSLLTLLPTAQCLFSQPPIIHGIIHLGIRATTPYFSYRLEKMLHLDT